MRAFLALLIASVATAAPPSLERLEPWGAQQGSAVRVVLIGKSLGAAQLELETSLPSAVTRLSTSPEDDGPSFLIETPADARPGRYPVRVRTEEGISNVLLFAIGRFPEVSEAESAELEPSGLNDSRETAQVVEYPTTIQGRLVGPDRDYFRFQAKAGQRLVFEADARRSGSAIDPHIGVVDSSGRPLTRSSDAPGLGADARAEHTFTSDGEYYVWIRDERFSIQAADFYRLTIAEYDYPEGVFPLGWRRGEAVEVELFGGSYAEPRHAKITPEGISETRVEMADLPFLLGDDPETLEPAGEEKSLEPGMVVNGRIASEGEVDRYSLEVTPGEQWSFELISAEAAASQLYGVLTVADQDGKTLATAGTYQGDRSLSRINYTGQIGTTGHVSFEVPEKVSALEISVEDLLERGGPAFSYRLSARKQPPDFLLTLDTPYVNIPARGSARVRVTAERRGYFGRIDVTVENPPPGLIVGGGGIAEVGRASSAIPRFSSQTVTLTAKPGVASARFELNLVGRAKLADGTVIERRAVAPGLVTPVQGDRPVRADWAGLPLAAAIAPEEPGIVEFLTPRKLRVVFGGKQHTVRWKFTPRGSARLAKAIVIPRDAGGARFRVNKEKSKRDQGEFQLFPHERTAPGPKHFQLEAQVADGDEVRTILSAPLEIEVVPGYSIDPPPGEVLISAGEASRFSGKVTRDPEFPYPVKVRAEGLPLGVECAEAVLEPGEETYSLSCDASASAQPGEYEVDLLATSQLSDEGTTPYDLEPLAAKLVVEGARRASR